MARKTKNIPTRNKFIIITNGKESEKNYFTKLRGFRRSVYDIEVEFDNAAPLSLVQRAVREKNSSNTVWIVFDKDEFPKDAVYRAMQIAKQENIGVAFSNIAFEVWLISHFREFSLEKNADELLDILDMLLKNHGYKKGYEKNDEEVFEKQFLPVLETAVRNSDVSLQKRIAAYNSNRPNDKNYPYCDWNSCTTVHKLIKALKLEPKNESNQ